MLTKELVAGILKARRGRSLFLIDIAVPRDVDPSANDLENVYLYDIDDLQRIAAETMRGRLAEAQRAERIVDEEADAFESWMGSLRVTPAIVALRSHVQAVLTGELNKSLGGKLKHLGPDERKALESMMQAAVNKLTHEPSTRLKAAAAEGDAAELVDSLQQLFGLSSDASEALISARDSKPSPKSPGNGSGSSQPKNATARPDAELPPPGKCTRDAGSLPPDAPKEVS